MEPVESHHRRLDQAVPEPEGCRPEGACWTGVDLGVVVLIKTLLKGFQLKETHYFRTCKSILDDFYKIPESKELIYKNLRVPDRAL
jgi:hypothetical protein